MERWNPCFHNFYTGTQNKFLYYRWLNVSTVYSLGVLDIPSANFVTIIENVVVLHKISEKRTGTKKGEKCYQFKRHWLSICRHYQRHRRPDLLQSRGHQFKDLYEFSKDWKLRKCDLVTLFLYIASPAEFLNFRQNLIIKDGLPCANYIWRHSP